MIFVTVGSQAPFDRLISAMDKWAGLHSRSDIVAQTAKSKYLATNIKTISFLNPADFRKMVGSASVVVSHAGMGSIIDGLELGKKIIVMPRRMDLGETRNDHQLATARKFLEQGRIIAAFDEEELFRYLDEPISLDSTKPRSIDVSPTLIEAVRNFISENS